MLFPNSMESCQESIRRFGSWNHNSYIKRFLKLILIAMLIASTFAWWVMNHWLHDFAYRINISWKIFAIAGVISTLIALLTVSFQAIKAAMANPEKSLRSE